MTTREIAETIDQLIQVRINRATSVPVLGGAKELDAITDSLRDKIAAGLSEHSWQKAADDTVKQFKEEI